MNRPTWDDYFFSIAELTKDRSNCIKRKVGCIIVKNNRIISLGYNGTPSGVKNCYDGGCNRCNNTSINSGEKLDECLCLHAEENALLFVSKADLQDSNLYVTLIPCISCVKKIIQCGIKNVFYNESYNELDDYNIKTMNDNNINVIKFVKK